MPPLQFHHRYTQIIFGFIKRIISYSNIFDINNIAFAWDSKFSLRREIYPIYKMHRVRKLDKESDIEKNNRRIASLQFTEIRESVLQELGFKNIFMQDGYEADDIMASIVNNNDGDFIVVTTDADMYQIISDNCKLYNPRTKILRDKEFFINEWGIDPSKWGEVKAIAGCPTDNVIGIKGVAEKTAVNYLLGKMNPKSKVFNRIESSKDMIAENRELVVLPMHGTKDVKLSDDNNICVSNFVDLCDEYGFKSLMKENKAEEWSNILC